MQKPTRILSVCMSLLLSTASQARLVDAAINDNPLPYSTASQDLNKPFDNDDIIVVKRVLADESGQTSQAYPLKSILIKEVGVQDEMVEEESSHYTAADQSLDEEVNDVANDHKSLPRNAIKFTYGALEGKFQVKYKPESFYAYDANLLNKNNNDDSIFYSRATLDVNLGLGYGRDYFGHNAVNFFTTIRNQANWGNPESIARTTRTRIKTLEYVDNGHQHAITRHILWLRELWLDFSLTDVFNLPTQHQHNFKLGAFPFELGRGISLGAAYAVSPGFLGFYSDNTINQYAYGFKFSGNVFSSLEYDLYAAILRNQMDSFAVTSEAVRGQEYGHRLSPELGTGRLDMVLAGRMRWYPIKSETSSAAFEPYALYNHVPSQMVEFPNDASGELYTLGLAGEYVVGNFEWGFDIAKNLGHQTVKGWDRNQVNIENRLGNYTFVNSQTRTAVNDGGQAVVFVAGSPAQTIINSAPEGALQNNVLLAAGVPNPANPATTIDIYNSTNRFRDPYQNKFKGWMATADAAYWFADRQVRLAGAFGYATGDENPNKDLQNPNDSRVDGDYTGFIGLQEIYSGDRVQSVFFLGGAGRAPRPLSQPSRATSDTTPTVVSGFTNIIFTGGSVLWSPKGWSRDFNIRPNVLSYWQQHATKAYNILTSSVSPNTFARNYLGTEINLFFDISLLNDFKFYAVTSGFFPGSHYTDIKGQPLSRDQQKFLNRLNGSGLPDEALARALSNDFSYTLNVGLEYRF